jgi:hypothetical protein
MTRSNRPASSPAITKPIAAIVIPFDDADRLPADVEIKFRDGTTKSVSHISTEPHLHYPNMTVFRARFGESGGEFIVDLTVADEVLNRISRRGKGGDASV